MAHVKPSVECILNYALNYRVYEPVQYVVLKRLINEKNLNTSYLRRQLLMGICRPEHQHYVRRKSPQTLEEMNKKDLEIVQQLVKVYGLPKEVFLEKGNPNYVFPHGLCTEVNSCPLEVAIRGGNQQLIKYFQTIGLTME